MEQFKEIQGLDGRYSIGDKGTIISHPKTHSSGYKGRGVSHRKERILNGTTDKEGYRVINFKLNNKTVAKKIHRLVAEAFIPNPENKMEVNHLDGDKTNNAASNLAWATRSENSKHAWATGLNKGSEKQKQAARENGQKLAKSICAYDIKTNELLWVEQGINAACKKYNLDKRTVQRVLGGSPKHKQHKGMRFILTEV